VGRNDLDDGSGGDFTGHIVAIPLIPHSPDSVLNFGAAFAIQI
jgi:hypothetical protein